MIKNTLPQTELTLSDFHYDLPPERIAQTPITPRDASRLLVMNRETGKLEHRTFRDILEYIRPEDVLVLNDTKVIPARIIGRRAYKAVSGSVEKSDSTAPVELLLLKQTERMYGRRLRDRENGHGSEIFWSSATVSCRRMWKILCREDSGLYVLPVIQPPYTKRCTRSDPCPCPRI